ncbi:MAG: hypothetical protein ABI882_22110, partial [Acidobacteriota bacterium]
MKRISFACLVITLTVLGSFIFHAAAQVDEAHWPQWRGPAFNGMARGNAPVEWNSTKNVRWKIQIAGRGHSTPVVWGDRIFLTTAVPIPTPTPAPAPASDAVSTPAQAPQGGRGGGRGGAGGGAGVSMEHKLIVMAVDRRSGRVLWERVAKVIRP